MIIVFTGNGKGKTTAALGQMMRVLGRKKKALMIQFIKGPWISGEDRFAEKYNVPKEDLEIRKRGLGFVGILGDTRPKKEHAAAAAKALEEFKEELAKGEWHLMILDEVNNAVSLGIVSVAEVIEAIKDFPKEKILILTGRDAPKEFIELADLATEMKELKHPYNDFKLGKDTVEF
jgi:cob(I)alamin adenosyltransferase